MTNTSTAPISTVVPAAIFNRLYKIIAAARDKDGLIEGVEPGNVLVVAKDSMEAIRKTVKYLQELMPDRGVVAIELGSLDIVASPTEAVVIG